MATVKIDRQEKNIMRAKIEDVLQMQKDIDVKINSYAATSQPVEYQKFWQDLQTRNQDTIRKVSRYMIAKCNR